MLDAKRNGEDHKKYQGQLEEMRERYGVQHRLDIPMVFYQNSKTNSENSKIVFCYKCNGKMNEVPDPETGERNGHLYRCECMPKNSVLTIIEDKN